MSSCEAGAFAGGRAAMGHLQPLVITQSGGIGGGRAKQAQKLLSVLMALRCAPAAHDDHWHGSVAHIDLGLDTIGWWHSLAHLVVPSPRLVLSLDGVRFA